MPQWSLMLVLAGVLAMVGLSSGVAQVDGPQTTCEEARVWHLREALSYTERGDQAYHLGAAEAAGLLEEYGVDACDGWRDDATGLSWDAENGASQKAVAE